MTMATIRRRKRRPNAKGKKPFGRLKTDARRSTAKWKRRGKKCVKKSETRYLTLHFMIFSFFAEKIYVWLILFQIKLNLLIQNRVQIKQRNTNKPLKI